jgi:mannose-1-phosphate guanylyltransferase/phosphomannomutase
VEKLAYEYNGSVIRTKTSRQDLMSKILSREKKDGTLEQFSMYFDAIAGLVKILDFMNLNNLSLAQLIDMIPEFHISRQEVECPWNAKGKVIRKIIQENSAKNIETLEGVKIHQEDGWVLVLPDAEKPVCRVICESATAEFADELTNIYVKKVKDISSS